MKINARGGLLTIFAILMLSTLPACAKKVQNAPKPPVLNETHLQLGIDVLAKSNFEAIKGKKIALLTNFSGRTSTGELSAELMAKSDYVRLMKIFTPEHGFYPAIPAGEKVNNSMLFGVPCVSLYGQNRKPTAEQMADIEAVVIDIQDVGVRSYTYISTMFNLLEACAENDIPAIVLDRPNPLGGTIVDGNVLELKHKSFIGIAPLTYLHGCTVGELAKMFAGEHWIKQSAKLNLQVIAMNGWRREMTWEDTGLMWFPTSPNIPTVNAVRGAAMLGTFGELGVFNIGIGSTLPFQYIGLATDLRDNVLANLDASSMAGISLSPCYFPSGKGKFYGFFLNFRDLRTIKPYTQGVKLILAFRAAYPKMFDITKVGGNAKAMFVKAVGSEELYNAIMKKASAEYVLKVASKGVEDFMKLRAKYLIYK